MSAEDKLTVTYEGMPYYDIVFEEDFSKLKESISFLSLENAKICVVTDSNVALHHKDAVLKALHGSAKTVTSFTFPAGEPNKNLETVQHLYEFLIQNSFDRNDVLIALGGGVTGDLTGFCAATYLRGIRFIQVPTSLLAMVDSSIGGKTGVDFKAYKNMVGAFYMPKLVYINLSALKTLPEREYLSGMGEIIKHGCIQDVSYCSFLKEKRELILSRDLAAVRKMIHRSCEIKQKVVQEDPKELSIRAFLNFGHTIGHAVEKKMDFTLLHGECVSIGMAGALSICAERNFITASEKEEILSLLKSYRLPVTMPACDVNELLSIMQKDKKMDSGVIKFVLLKPLGKAVIDRTVTQEEIKKALNELIKERYAK